MNGVPIMCPTKKKQKDGQAATTKNVVVTRRGARMTVDDLLGVLEGECGARCMDDFEDALATAKALLKNFKIYRKLARRVQRKV